MAGKTLYTPVIEPKELSEWCRKALSGILGRDAVKDLHETISRFRIDGHVFSWLLSTGRVNTLGIQSIASTEVTHIKNQFYASHPNAKPGSAHLYYVGSQSEIACQVNFTAQETHPNWRILNEILRDPRGSDQAFGVASTHSQPDREEIARKLISNHQFVISDVCNPSTHLNVEGKPLTQTELQRVDVDLRPYVDQMLREVARRLLGCRPGVETVEEMPDRFNTQQAAAWRACARYLEKRTQYKHEQRPSRKADMSPAAAAAFIDVLHEVASDAERNRADIEAQLRATVVVQQAHPNWHNLAEAIKDPAGSEQAVGVAAAHSAQAREEAARKLITNHKFVIADVTNPSPHLNVEGKMLTQTELKRVDVMMRPYVDQMLRELARRLLGRRRGLEQLQESPDPKIPVQARAWRCCATYLEKRTHCRPDQKPSRNPDMSEAAYAAFIGVLNELASEAEDASDRALKATQIGQMSNPMLPDTTASPRSHAFPPMLTQPSFTSQRASADNMNGNSNNGFTAPASEIAQFPSAMLPGTLASSRFDASRSVVPGGQSLLTSQRALADYMNGINKSSGLAPLNSGFAPLASEIAQMGSATLPGTLTSPRFEVSPSVLPGPQPFLTSNQASPDYMNGNNIGGFTAAGPSVNGSYSPRVPGMMPQTPPQQGRTIQEPFYQGSPANYMNGSGRFAPSSLVSDPLDDASSQRIPTFATQQGQFGLGPTDGTYSPRMLGLTAQQGQLSMGLSTQQGLLG